MYAVIAAGQLVIDDGKQEPKEMQDALPRALADIPQRFPRLRWGRYDLVTREAAQHAEAHGVGGALRRH